MKTDMKNPIVEEVRKARQAHAEEFNHDIEAIYEDLKRIEKNCGHKVVSLSPRLLKKPSDQPLSSAVSQ